VTLTSIRRRLTGALADSLGLRDEPVKTLVWVLEDVDLGVEGERVDVLGGAVDVEHGPGESPGAEWVGVAGGA